MVDLGRAWRETGLRGDAAQAKKANLDGSPSIVGLRPGSALRHAGLLGRPRF
jgi:hypothetical protein